MIVGSLVDEAYAVIIRQKIQKLLGNSKTEWFNGAEPEHLCASQFSVLEANDYLVSLRGTGLRAFLFIHITADGPATFLFTSQNALWYNPMVFPIANNPNHFLNDTLLDGELNLVQGSPQLPATFSYTAFDLIAIGGVSIAQRSFSTRLGILQQDIIKPRNNALMLSPNLKQPFTVELPRYERSYGLKIIMGPNEGTDTGRKGLIFTPIRAPYTPGRSRIPAKPFQWFFPEYQTCYFKLLAAYTKDRKVHYQLLIADKQSHKYFDDFTPDEERLREWRTAPPDGKVLRCRFDPDWETLVWENGYAGIMRKGGWRFVDFCNHRTFADDERDIKARWTSLMQPVSVEMLEGSLELLRSSWKSREQLHVHIMASASNSNVPAPAPAFASPWERRPSQPSPVKSSPPPSQPPSASSATDFQNLDMSATSNLKKRKASDDFNSIDFKVQELLSGSGVVEDGEILTAFEKGASQAEIPANFEGADEEEEEEEEEVLVEEHIVSVFEANDHFIAATGDATRGLGILGSPLIQVTSPHLLDFSNGSHVSAIDGGEVVHGGSVTFPEKLAYEALQAIGNVENNFSVPAPITAPTMSFFSDHDQDQHLLPKVEEAHFIQPNANSSILHQYTPLAPPAQQHHYLPSLHQQQVNHYTSQVQPSHDLQEDDGGRYIVSPPPLLLKKTLEHQHNLPNYHHPAALTSSGGESYLRKGADEEDYDVEEEEEEEAVVVVVGGVVGRESSFAKQEPYHQHGGEYQQPHGGEYQLQNHIDEARVLQSSEVEARNPETTAKKEKGKLNFIMN